MKKILFILGLTLLTITSCKKKDCERLKSHLDQSSYSYGLAYINYENDKENMSKKNQLDLALSSYNNSKKAYDNRGCK